MGRPTKYTINDMKQLARNNQGECLSETYQRIDKPLLWKCKDGHEWTSKATYIVEGSWCMKCYQNTRRIGIKKMHQVAHERGGKCLSDIYITCDDKLQWECQYGHRWLATPDKIKNAGQWCPTCSLRIKKGERLCRNIFEKIFKTKFPTVRPSWLKNPKTGYCLELDGYAKDIGIAFEYQGQHHYETAYSFSAPTDLKNIQYKDKIKKYICNENNIILLQIPYFIDISNINICIDNIIDILKTNNITMPHSDFSDLNINDHHDPSRDRFFNIIKEKNGFVIGDYITSNTKIKIQCRHKHEWMATPTKIKCGTWCPKCGGRKKLTLKDIHIDAKNNNGECLSSIYINAVTPMLWKCDKGHTWKAKPNHIRNGHWCPICARNQKSITIDNIKYDNINNASDILNIDKNIIYYRIKSSTPKWTRWHYNQTSSI